MTDKEFNDKHKDNPILSKMRTMEREDLLRVINGTYIAERFFGKSGSWFRQKLNNSVTNGTPCEFNDEELKIFRNALYTLALELEELADGLQ